MLAIACTLLGTPARAADTVQGDAGAVFAHRCQGPVRVTVDRQVGVTADVTWSCNGTAQKASFVQWYGTWWYTPQDLTTGIDVTTTSGETVLTPPDTSTDGYEVVLRLKTSKAGAKLRVIARMPTEAESWESPGGNGEFFMSIENLDDVPLQTTGGTLHVCYPFVASVNRAHTFTLAPATPNLGPILGTLNHNCLDYVLPAFAVGKHTEAFGEIDFS